MSSLTSNVAFETVTANGGRAVPTFTLTGEGQKAIVQRIQTEIDAINATNGTRIRIKETPVNGTTVVETVGSLNTHRKLFRSSNLTELEVVERLGNGLRAEAQAAADALLAKVVRPIDPNKGFGVEFNEATSGKPAVFRLSGTMAEQNAVSEHIAGMLRATASGEGNIKIDIGPGTDGNLEVKASYRNGSPEEVTSVMRRVAKEVAATPENVAAVRAKAGLPAADAVRQLTAAEEAILKRFPQPEGELVVPRPSVDGPLEVIENTVAAKPTGKAPAVELTNVAGNPSQVLLMKRIAMLEAIKSEFQNSGESPHTQILCDKFNAETGLDVYYSSKNRFVVEEVNSKGERACLTMEEILTSPEKLSWLESHKPPSLEPVRQAAPQENTPVEQPAPVEQQTTVKANPKVKPAQLMQQYEISKPLAGGRGTKPDVSFSAGKLTPEQVGTLVEHLQQQNPNSRVGFNEGSKRITVFQSEQTPAAIEGQLKSFLKTNPTLRAPVAAEAVVVETTGKPATMKSFQELAVNQRTTVATQATDVAAVELTNAAGKPPKVVAWNPEVAPPDVRGPANQVVSEGANTAAPEGTVVDKPTAPVRGRLALEKNKPARPTGIPETIDVDAIRESALGRDAKRAAAESGNEVFEEMVKGTREPKRAVDARPWWKKWLGIDKPDTESIDKPGTKTGKARVQPPADAPEMLVEEIGPKAAPRRAAPARAGGDVELVVDSDGNVRTAAKDVPEQPRPAARAPADTPDTSRQTGRGRIQPPADEPVRLVADDASATTRKAAPAPPTAAGPTEVGTFKLSGDATQQMQQLKFLKGRLSGKIGSINEVNGEIIVTTKGPLSPEALRRIGADLNDFQAKLAAEPAKGPAKNAAPQDAEPIKKPGMFNGPDKGSEFEARIEAARQKVAKLEADLASDRKIGRTERGILEKDLARTKNAIGELEKGVIPEEAKITPKPDPKKVAGVRNEPTEPARARASRKAILVAEPLEPAPAAGTGGGGPKQPVAAAAEAEGAVNHLHGSKMARVGGGLGIVFGGYQLKKGLEEGNLVETGLGATNLASGVGMVAATAFQGKTAAAVGSAAGKVMLIGAAVSIGHEAMKEQGTGADDKWAYRGARAAAGAGSLGVGMAAASRIAGKGWLGAIVGTGVAVGTTIGTSYVANAAIDAHKEDKIANKKMMKAEDAEFKRLSIQGKLEQAIKVVSNDGSTELKKTDFDPLGTGKLDLANFAEPNGMFTKKSLDTLNQKVKAMDEIVEKTKTPELTKLRNSMKALATDAKKRLGMIESEQSTRRNPSQIGINTNSIAESNVILSGVPMGGNVMAPNTERAMAGLVPLIGAGDTGMSVVTTGVQVDRVQRQADVPQGNVGNTNAALL